MRFFLAIVFLIYQPYLFAQQPTHSAQQEIVFQQVNVIPMDREYVLKDQTVVIKDGKIRAITDGKTAKYSKNALVINGKGKYLIPGLAEMHAHVPPINELDLYKKYCFCLPPMVSKLSGVC